MVTVAFIVSFTETMLQTATSIIYILIFLCSVLESNPFTGFFFPGMVMVIIGGALAGANRLSLLATLAIAALGAMTGDLIGFIVGKKYGRCFLAKYGKYFLLKEKHGKKIDCFLKEHTGKALVIGRFNPLTRALIPFFAGKSKVSFNKFIAYNILGGILWSVVFVFLGYFFGIHLRKIASYSWGLAILAIAAFFIVFLAFHIKDSKRKGKRKGKENKESKKKIN